jgi:hypothetical protein
MLIQFDEITEVKFPVVVTYIPSTPSQFPIAPLNKCMLFRVLQWIVTMDAMVLLLENTVITVHPILWPSNTHNKKTIEIWLN